MPRDYKHNCPCPHHPFECFGHPTTCACAKDEAVSPRFINCEVCQTEGRILTSNGGPDEIDNGPCPACNGECVVEVETAPMAPCGCSSGGFLATDQE